MGWFSFEAIKLGERAEWGKFFDGMKGFWVEIVSNCLNARSQAR